MRTLLRLKWPIVLTVIGAGLTAWVVRSLFVSFADPGISFLVPGETTFTITKPGNYTLWSEVEASFDGQLMTFPTGLPPGVTIKIIKKPDGSVVPLRSKWPTTREDRGGVIRVAIGTVRFDTPGPYRLSTDGLKEKRTLHLNQFEFNKLFLTISLAFVSLLLVLVGLVWGIAVFAYYRNSRPNQPMQTTAGRFNA
jgi:hypothetical protein